MVILGSTGSIGINALKVAKKFNMNIEAISCNSNVELFNAQIKEFNPKYVAICDESKIAALKPRDSRVYVGSSGVKEMIKKCKSKKILNAIIGFAGLNFSLISLKQNKKLILANKETLVIGGNIIKEILTKRENSDKDSKKRSEKSSKNPNFLKHIFPVDSEHFSLYQLGVKKFKKLYITASGGALRNVPLDSINNASVKEVLNHPTWDMGAKITIDSATLINKLYEILEAFWLFNTIKIDAIIEKSSIVHAFIECYDGSFKAFLSGANMCLPLAYGLDSKSAKKHFSIEKISLNDFAKISFAPIEMARYPLWEFKEMLLSKPSLGVVLNAANENLQTLFLEKKIKFGEFHRILPLALKKFSDIKICENLIEIYDLRNEVIDFTNFLLKK